ncbi:MAG: hypothetical protein HKN80_07745 [Acidimicrobiia bacterium]|nr:hypothetical protein [Acidimicrobiia bacterium]
MTEQRTAERRVAAARFRYPERRTGFDRRAPSGAIAWYRDHPPVLALALAAVIALNVADYLFTVRALDRGAIEVNPLMATLFDIDPALAGAVKVLLGIGVVLVIWQMRRYRRMLEVSLLAVAGFSLVFAYQLALVASGA